MDTKILLGKRLREIRKRKKLKQEQLAELINVEPASISNIENGRNFPSLQTLENIIRTLDTSFSEIFEFEHKKEVANLLDEINTLLKNNPDRIEDIYKIIKALVL